MQWGDTITITKAENGFILEEEGVLLDGEEVLQEYVIEEMDDEEHVCTMLRQVKEYFGYYHGKHNKRNLVIEWVEREVEL